jgi:VWFA-related protein
MSASIGHLARFACSAFLTLTISVLIVCGQTERHEDPDVVRINTELVQTGVMVFDKHGKFVDGLKRDQFELRVDGKPVQFSSFDRVTAWTAEEEKQILAATSNVAKTTEAPINLPTATSPRGRTIIFFIDDLHLSLDSLARTRGALNHFLDNEMTPLDQVAFTSASGQIGFLQQLTDNKAVLRAALARLTPIPYVVRDNDLPPMTEFIAIKVVNGDTEALDYYAEEYLRRYTRPQKGINKNAIYQMIKNRANQILLGLESVTSSSFESLANLLDTTGRIAGRKLIFFISDGFYLDARNSMGAANERLRRVTDKATRTGSVIYTIDARGLFAPFVDASGDRPFDPSGRLDRANVGEGVISQEGLSALAGDTGGRFLKNQNYFDTWVARMLDETSNYYLLAWRPPTEEQKGGRFKRVEVSIVGRPDLTVRLPRGFLTDTAMSAKAEVKPKLPDTSIPEIPKASPSGPEASLIAALSAPSARKGLPTKLSVSFLDVPATGLLLTAATQLATDVLNYGADGKETAAVDLAGLVLNDHGKQAGSFKTRLNVKPSSATAAQNPSVIYTHKLVLKPGIYQVRVAARDDKSGRVGSAAQWIEIPDLAAKRLTLSSLLIGVEPTGSSQNSGSANGGEQVQFSVDHHFRHGSHLNFLTIIYNAARANNGSTDLEAQVLISRFGKAVITSPLRKVTTDANAADTDLGRIVYGANVGLQALPAGRYVLRVNIFDRAAKSNASSEVSFEVE